ATITSTIDAEAEKSKLDRYVILPAALLASQRSAGNGLPDSTGEIFGTVSGAAVVCGAPVVLPGAAVLAPVTDDVDGAAFSSPHAAITTSGNNSSIATRRNGMR